MHSTAYTIVMEMCYQSLASLSAILDYLVICYIILIFLFVGWFQNIAKFLIFTDFIFIHLQIFIFPLICAKLNRLIWLP